MEEYEDVSILETINESLSEEPLVVTKPKLPRKSVATIEQMPEVIEIKLDTSISDEVLLADQELSKDTVDENPAEELYLVPTSIVDTASLAQESNDIPADTEANNTSEISIEEASKDEISLNETPSNEQNIEENSVSDSTVVTVISENDVSNDENNEGQNKNLIEIVAALNLKADSEDTIADDLKIDQVENDQADVANDQTENDEADKFTSSDVTQKSLIPIMDNQNDEIPLDSITEQTADKEVSIQNKSLQAPTPSPPHYSANFNASKRDSTTYAEYYLNSKRSGSLAVPVENYDQYQLNELREIFQLYDSDKDNYLGKGDLEILLKSIHPSLANKNKISAFIGSATNHSEVEKISQTQFNYFFGGTYFGKFTRYELKYVFDLLDKNHDGYLNKDDLEVIFDSLNWTDKFDMDSVFSEMDFNKDGNVCFEDFKKLMSSEITL